MGGRFGFRFRRSSTSSLRYHSIFLDRCLDVFDRPQWQFPIGGGQVSPRSMTPDSIPTTVAPRAIEFGVRRCGCLEFLKRRSRSWGYYIRLSNLLPLRPERLSNGQLTMTRCATLGNRKDGERVETSPFPLPPVLSGFGSYKLHMASMGYILPRSLRTCIRYDSECDRCK